MAVVWHWGRLQVAVELLTPARVLLTAAFNVFTSCFHRVIHSNYQRHQYKSRSSGRILGSLSLKCCSTCLAEYSVYHSRNYLARYLSVCSSTKSPLSCDSPSSHVLQQTQHSRDKSIKLTSFLGNISDAEQKFWNLIRFYKICFSGCIVLYEKQICLLFPSVHWEQL
jgi:hypothetical protein